MQFFTAPLQQDPTTGEYLIELPPEFLSTQDWRAGDRIEYVPREGGGFTVVNHCKAERQAQAEQEAQAEREALPLFIVETVTSHRIRYAIRAKNAEHAMDVVTMEEAVEFDQNHLGEQIFSTREVTEAEYFKAADLPTDPALKRELIHVVDYDRP